jgi:hypothetical protein
MAPLADKMRANPACVLSRKSDPKWGSSTKAGRRLSLAAVYQTLSVVGKDDIARMTPASVTNGFCGHAGGGYVAERGDDVPRCKYVGGFCEKRAKPP